jgi:hypothetical protein
MKKLIQKRLMERRLVEKRLMEKRIMKVYHRMKRASTCDLTIMTVIRSTNTGANGSHPRN